MKHIDKSINVRTLTATRAADCRLNKTGANEMCRDRIRSRGL